MNPFSTAPGWFDLRWRMFGTPVRVKIWFFLFMAFFGFLMGINPWEERFRGDPAGRNERLVLILIWVICGFIAVMVHEMGHILAGRRFGIPGVIILHAMGGGAVGEYLKAERWQRILIAAAGPAFGLGAYLIVYFATPVVIANLRIRDVVWEERINFILIYFAFMFLFWNLLNLLPIMPMDGGMITRDLLGYAIGKYDDLVARILSVAVAFGIAWYCWTQRENNSFLAGIFQPLYPSALRNQPFAARELSPTFMAFMYAFIGIMNLLPLLSRKK